MGDKKMDVERLNSNIKKYFFYGMDNKDTVIEYIILKEADHMLKQDMSKINTELYKVEYTIQQIKRKIVQLYRFVYMNEPAQKQTYFYHKINENSIEIEQLVQAKIKDLDRRSIITGGLKNSKDSAIYITGGDPYHRQYPGRDYYNNLKENPNNKWIQEDVVPLLEQLCEIETQNKEQYYALYLDTKYNRVINAQEQLRAEQEYLESIQQSNQQERIEEVKKIRAALPNQKEEIKKVFSQFMNSVKLPKQDILAIVGQKGTKEMYEDIEQNSSDYYTISTLKQEAEDEIYQNRLNKKVEELKSKHFEEEIR